MATEETPYRRRNTRNRNNHRNYNRRNYNSNNNNRGQRNGLFQPNTNTQNHVERYHIELDAPDGTSQTLQMVSYYGNLYRAETFRPAHSWPITANRYYQEDPKALSGHIHFFTTQYKETYTYESLYGVSSKQWVVNQNRPLHLIDVLDVPTRIALEHFVSADLLQTSFPLHPMRNRVYRFSEETTAATDRLVAAAFCTMQDVDGYYMDPQISAFNRGQHISSFHSEVGLCDHAFSALHLAGYSTRKVPPRTTYKKHKPTLSRSLKPSALSFTNLRRGGHRQKGFSSLPK